MTILSIQYHSHDTSVALIRGGEVMYASSNERFSRIKMDKNFPIEALKNCLKFTKVYPDQIDKVAIVGVPPFPQGFFELLNLFTMELRLTKGERLLWSKNLLQFLKPLVYILAFLPAYIYKEVYPFIRLKLALRGFKGKYIFVPHHESHLYSSYYTSGWNECLVVCFEGGGRLKTMSVYYVKNNQWSKITECSLPHSAGTFYGLSTYLLGFKPLRHEGKITGLSAFGNPQKAYRMVKSLLWVEGLQLRLDFKQLAKIVFFCTELKKIPENFKHFKKEDIAAAFQQRLEDCILKILKEILSNFNVDKIALAGGVMANVKLNQKIFELPSIKQIFIFPAMGDDGLALGAALYLGYQNGTRIKRLKNVYFGPSFSEKEILKALKKYKIKWKFYQNVEKEIAKLLAQGFVVARFNGRMEYGPRALGNRSILCQATEPQINKILNSKLKRTEFMPFAPVTLKEYAKLCFNNLKGAEYAAKFMTITFNCSKYMKDQSPAVVHVDGTARPQIIEKKDNPSYYKILKEYYELTKIPTLINTSFNMHEEPMVCTPDDAVRSFLSGQLDYLAISNYLVSMEKT